MQITIRLSRRGVAICAALVAAVLAAGAIAAWTVSGSGSASAKAVTASPITLTDASASTIGDLYPSATGSVKIKVANPNPFPVRVTAVALTSGETVTSNVTACNTGGSGVTFTNQTGLALDLAANAGATVFTLSGAVSMSNASDNSCQGAVFTIPVTVTATSQ